MRPLLPYLLAVALVSLVGDRLAADPIAPIGANTFASAQMSSEPVLADPPVERGYVDDDGNLVTAAAAAPSPLHGIPEPTTLALLVGGLTGLAYAGRSRSAS